MRNNVAKRGLGDQEMSEDKTVHFATVEGIIERLDRVNRRLVAIVVLLIVLLVGSNIAWLVYESQFQEVTTETQIDAWQDGNTNLVSGGDMYYGPESQGKD